MTKPNAPRLCTTCKFCVQEDYGYSDYTMEGTTLACLRGLNAPINGIDNGDKNLAEVIRFAETCAYYEFGDGPTRDVDCEVTAEEYKDDPDVYELLKARWG